MFEPHEILFASAADIDPTRPVSGVGADQRVTAPGDFRIVGCGDALAPIAALFVRCRRA